MLGIFRGVGCPWIRQTDNTRVAGTRMLRFWSGDHVDAKRMSVVNGSHSSGVKTRGTIRLVECTSALFYRNLRLLENGQLTLVRPAK